MSKYKAIPTVVDNIRFASKHEAQQYISFRALEKAGAIKKLELQVPFIIHAFPSPEMLSRIMTLDPIAPLKPICKYIADFVVTELDGTMRLYDAKGMKTPIYKLKKKFVEAEYGIRIVEL